MHDLLVSRFLIENVDWPKKWRIFWANVKTN